MYLLIEKTHDNMDFVHLGPMNWRPSFFQSVLRDDLDIEFKVPLSNDRGEAIIVNDIARIIPVIDIGITSEYNPKIQRLVGPKYNFSETSAEMYYDVEDKTVEVVKEELKPIIAANRYRYEVKGTTVIIQDKQLSVLTTREDRGLYLQAYQLGKDGVNWKFGSEFLTLSNADLATIVEAVSVHVQSVFDWESAKIAAIDACTTLEELNNLSLVSDNTDLEPVLLTPSDLGLPV
jgi:hypothetical protein